MGLCTTNLICSRFFSPSLLLSHSLSSLFDFLFDIHARSPTTTTMRKKLFIFVYIHLKLIYAPRAYAVRIVAVLRVLAGLFNCLFNVIYKPFIASKDFSFSGIAVVMSSVLTLRAFRNVCIGVIWHNTFLVFIHFTFTNFPLLRRFISISSSFYCCCCCCSYLHSGFPPYVCLIESYRLTVKR